MGHVDLLSICVKGEKKRNFSRQQQGEGSLMLWGDFDYGDKYNLDFLSGKMKAIYYQKMIEKHLLQFS